MKTSQMKLEVKSKTHKKSKLAKEKLIKRSLCIIFGFFLILITYYEKMVEKDKLSLITYNNNNLYTNVTKNNLLNILDKGTGIVIFINDKKTTNRIINLLYKINTNESIYLYNIKDEEIILNLDNSEIVVEQEPTDFYNKVINKLGSHANYYLLKRNDGSIIKTNNKKIYTPMVLFIKNGKILLSHYITDEDITDEELLDIYKKGFLMLKEYNL